MISRFKIRSNALRFFLLSLLIRAIDAFARYAIPSLNSNQRILLFFFSMLAVAILSLLALWIYWKDPNDARNEGCLVLFLLILNFCAGLVTLIIATGALFELYG